MFGQHFEFFREIDTFPKLPKIIRLQLFDLFQRVISQRTSTPTFNVLTTKLNALNALLFGIPGQLNRSPKNPIQRACLSRQRVRKRPLDPSEPTAAISEFSVANFDQEFFVRQISKFLNLPNY